MTMISGEQIPVYRLVVLKQALRLELKGMRASRGRSAYAIVKEEFNLRGNKERVYTQFCELVEKRKLAL
tara:strand:- start:126 stop:332 length:207 start_codon:yes stop_codon:yes gene_type:complete